MKNEKLMLFAQECVERGVSCKLVSKKSSRGLYGEEGKLETELCLEFMGFSKSGRCHVWQEGDDLVAHTRYEEREVVYDVEGLALMAKDWYERYADSGYGLPEEWLGVWKERGWVKETTVTAYELT